MKNNDLHFFVSENQRHCANSDQKWPNCMSSPLFTIEGTTHSCSTQLRAIYLLSSILSLMVLLSIADVLGSTLGPIRAETGGEGGGGGHFHADCSSRITLYYSCTHQSLLRYVNVLQGYQALVWRRCFCLQ